MRLRSGRNTGTISSNRPLPTAYLKSSGSFPRAFNKSQRGRRRYLRRGITRSHYVWKLSRRLNRGVYMGQHLRPDKVITSRPLPLIPEYTKKMLEDLHLPYYDSSRNGLDPALDPELSIRVLSERLGWTIATSEVVFLPSVIKEYSKDPSVAQAPRFQMPLHPYVREAGPAMNIPPTVYPDTDIDGEVVHQRYRFEHAGLALPIEWEPLNKHPIYEIDGATSDSVGISIWTVRRKPGLHRTASPQSPLSTESRPQQPAQTVSVSSNTLSFPRTRSQWDTLHTLQLRSVKWRLESSSIISQRDKRRRVGNIDYNQASRNKDSWPQTSIPVYTTYGPTSFYGYESPEDSDSDLSEAPTSPRTSDYSFNSPNPCPTRRPSIPMELASEYRLGDLISNIMTSDLLPISRNHIVNPPRAMKCLNQQLMLSMACQASPERLQWDQDHLPLLFVAQHCLQEGESRAKAEIAYSVHQTLITLVLYYLDTRSSLRELLPQWMVIYGITYNEKNYTVHAHFPVFHFSAADTDDSTPRTFGWAFYSNPVITFDVSGSRNSRRKEIVALLRIQSQARFLLSVLQGWDGYQRTLKRLHEGASSA